MKNDLLESLRLFGALLELKFHFFLLKFQFKSNKNPEALAEEKQVQIYLLYVKAFEKPVKRKIHQHNHPKSKNML